MTRPERAAGRPFDRQLRGEVPVRVVATGRLVLRPLELTRLTDELAIHPTLADALAAG